LRGRWDQVMSDHRHFCAGGSRFFRIKEAHSGNNKVWGRTGLIIQFHFDLKK